MNFITPQEFKGWPLAESDQSHGLQHLGEPILREPTFWHHHSSVLGTVQNQKFRTNYLDVPGS